MSKVEKGQALLEWVHSRGAIVHPSASLRDDPITGLSLYSTTEIGPNERLISCPFDLAITPEVATTAICGYTGVGSDDLIWPVGTSKAGEAWNERMRIGAYIGLHWVEKGKGKAKGSELLVHGPYIDALPSAEDLTTPLYFSSNELDLLSGTNLAGAIEDRRRDWQEESTVIRTTLKEDGLTWERYLAAATYLSSRAFPSKLLRLPVEGNGETKSTPASNEDDQTSHPILLPGVDLFNHARGQPILWLSSLVPSTSGLPTPSISLMTTQTHQSGSQLFNNYGPKPNEELLLGYGFVLPDNPDDTLILKLGIAQIPAEVKAKLESKGLDAGKRFAVRRDGALEKELLDVVRCLLDDHDHDHEIDEEDEHALHEHEEKEMELELAVLGMLSDMLEKKVERLSEGSVIAESSLKVRSSVREMCEIYRQGQHDILMKALEKLGERIERVEDMMDNGLGDCPCCA